MKWDLVTHHWERDTHTHIIHKPELILYFNREAIYICLHWWNESIHIHTQTHTTFSPFCVWFTPQAIFFVGLTMWTSKIECRWWWVEKKWEERSSNWCVTSASRKFGWTNNIQFACFRIIMQTSLIKYRRNYWHIRIRIRAHSHTHICAENTGKMCPCQFK